MTEIWPFLALITIQVPLPLSNIFMLCICVGTDIYPALSLAYEEAEFDIMTRKPRKLDEHLVSGKLLCHAYGNMGEIATAGGFFAYFTVMGVYGYPYNILFGLVSADAYNPSNDQNYNQYDAYDPNNITGSLAALYTGSCGKGQSYNPVDGFPDWLSLANSKVNLRTSFLTCTNGVLTPTFNWPSSCDRPNDISKISG
jgi:sodium/potassium-transporting ATPase subunit alpha